MGFGIIEDRPTPPAVYNWRIYLLAGIVAWGAMTIGYDTAFIGTTLALPAFKRDFGFLSRSPAWISQTMANMTSIFVAGGAFGSLFAWPCAERFGRIIPLQIGSFVFLVGAVTMTATTGNLAAMYAGRVLTGLGVGFLTAVVPMFIAETSPPAIRGRLIGLYDIAFQIGTIVGFWIIYGIQETLDVNSSVAYRIPMAVQLIPGGIFAIGTLFLHQSPAWLMRQDRLDEALTILSYLRNIPADHEYILQEVAMTHAIMEQEAQLSGGDRHDMWGYLRGSAKTTFGPRFRHRAILTFFMFVTMTWTGALVITYYSPSIFSAIGIKNVPLYTGIYGLFKTGGVLVFYLFVIDRSGRRIPWICSTFICCWCLVYMGAYTHIAKPGAKGPEGKPLPMSASSIKGGNAAIFFLMLYGTVWGFGGAGLPWVVSSEIFPISIRSFTGAYGSICHWIQQFAALMAGPNMKDKMGWGLFIFFAAMNFASCLFVFFFIPDTKGIPIECMDALFSGLSRYAQYRQKKVYPPHGMQPFNGDLGAAPKAKEREASGSSTDQV